MVEVIDAEFISFRNIGLLKLIRGNIVKKWMTAVSFWERRLMQNHFYAWQQNTLMASFHNKVIAVNFWTYNQWKKHIDSWKVFVKLRRVSHMENPTQIR